MKKLLRKEWKLSSSPLAFWFLLFSLMTFIPGYPILLSAFFVCMGLFQSFQTARENNDILYTVLLPIRKRDVVLSKYIFTVSIQMIAFLLCTVFTLIRMTLLSDAAVYLTNPLMNANPVYLAFLLLIYALFNLIFLGGFFRTAYKLGKPFLTFGAAAFLLVGLAETLHHLPGCSVLNSVSFTAAPVLWWIPLLAGVLYVSVTLLSCRSSMRIFESIDL